MIGYLRRFLIRNLVSPYGMAVIPYAIFLFAWVFPPDLYTHYVHEPDLMYLNPMVLLYYTLCVAAFLIGVRALGLMVRQPALSLPQVELRGQWPLTFLVLPLVLAAFPCLVYMLLIGASFNFIGLILSQQGDVMKQAITGGASGGFWGSALFLLTGVLWWSAYRVKQLPLAGSSRRIFWSVYAVCFAIDLMTCIATFDRTNLMPLLAGSTIIYLFLRTRGKDLRLGRLLLTGFGSVFLILGSFIALQFARAASHLDALITSMLGYTIVSYNRMAALILGSLHYVYERKGAYVVAFLLENERLRGIREQMELPTAYGLWLSEFPSLRAGGLNVSYNWPSVFGYLFSDLGWWTPVYMFAAGLLAGYLWSRFCSGATLGVVFYPWIAFWVLFWFGWNLLLDSRGIVLLETTVLLYFYDKLFLRPAGQSFPAARLVPRSTWEPGRLLPTAEMLPDADRGGAS